MSAPFALPDTLDRDLAPIHAYWKGLRRAANSMPFWDDVELSALKGEAANVLLIDVFDQPERFRFNYLADALKQGAAKDFKGSFFDEVTLPHPFENLRAQCSATVAARAPTYYRHEAANATPAYARLLLPMWGDGCISMLLGAIADVS